MPRELRPRKPRRSYADLADVEIETPENIAGPSKVHTVDEEGDSESEFEPDKQPRDSKKVPSSDEDEDVAMDDAQDPESEVEETPKQSRRPTASSRKPRTPIANTGSPTMFTPLKTRKEQSRRLPPRVQQATPAPSESTMPAIATPRAAKTYALPNPSAHHRHRAIPVLFREEMVERLDEPPSLFKEPHIVWTNSMTADHSLINRVSKSWGFNVGAGPVWQIMEDRSCYKESLRSGAGPEKESSRRPRVYHNVTVRPGWEVLVNQCVTIRWPRNLYSSCSRTEIAGMPSSICPLVRPSLRTGNLSHHPKSTATWVHMTVRLVLPSTCLIALLPVCKFPSSLC